MRNETLSLAENLKRESHRISALILNSDLQWIDIAIQINAMREMCLAEAPEKTELFDAVYASRFDRLWNQWRNQGGAEYGEGYGGHDFDDGAPGDGDDDGLEEFMA